MTLPIDYPFSPGNELINTSQLRNAYRSIAQAHNGFQSTFSPFVFGMTSEGSNARLTNTYVNRIGYLQITRQIADFWFDIEWANHNGTGNAAIYLPANAMGIAGNPWVATVVGNGQMANANGLYLSIEPGTSVAQVFASGSGSNVALTPSGVLKGSIRYIAQQQTAL